MDNNATGDDADGHRYPAAAGHGPKMPCCSGAGCLKTGEGHPPGFRSNHSALGRYKCSRCAGARYCSIGCQRQHWPAHKAFCAESQKQTKRSTDTGNVNQGPEQFFPVKRITVPLGKHACCMV